MKIRSVLGCDRTAMHDAHEWRSLRFGNVECDGLTSDDVNAMRAGAARAALIRAWEGAGSNPRSVSVRVQLAVVDYCTAIPGTPVPTLDDVRAVRTLVHSIA